MLKNLAVRAVENLAKLPKVFGLTADRPFTPKIIAASGKNFMNVPAVKPGGHGVAIDLPQSLPIKSEKFHQSCQIPLMISE